MSLPLTLTGANLGERHRELNSLVKQASTGQASFEYISALSECAPVDRLFKIDLAIELQNLDYILDTVKDDDMLYVSRALKCKWLLQRQDIIDPKYLEKVLFPEMVTTAVSKMKHWLYINLRDPPACRRFYQYYKHDQFDFAVKFLSHCDDEFVASEFPTILTKVTPHHLKVFVEKNPKLAKVYFDALATDADLVKRYLEEELNFYNSIKCVLKTEPSIFLDILEKYYPINNSCKLSPSATDYIVRCHKSRFMDKLELYMVHMLHLPTVAQRLSAEECEQVVVRLARADYISWWFSFAKVEPLVKRISRENRSAFKNRVFVDKDVGEHVNDWPYALPTSPEENTSGKLHVFNDQEFEPIKPVQHLGKRLVKKRKYCGAYECAMVSDFCPVKSDLQKLYDEFRFKGFEGTFHELRERLGAASSGDRRRDMLLVLVSKSGGRADSVRELLSLALKMRNEPVHTRAAVVRSLVKRASAWRLPQDVWDMMLEYARGLGLDGTEPEPECREGLHAVVLRQFITSGDCETTLREAFLENFSTFDEYKLVASERAKVCSGLERLLVSAAADAKPDVAASRLDQLLDVLKKYHMCVASSPVVSAIVNLAERDSEVAKPLLERLYEARVGRRELLRQYLELRHDDAALLNALRHEPGAIKTEWLVKLLIDGETQADQFLTKLAVYFNEAGGMAEHLRHALQAKVAQEPDVKLARPLATLADNTMMVSWIEQDVKSGNKPDLKSELCANIHRARPAPDAVALGWRKVGVKALAWRVTRCRSSQVTQLAQKLLAGRDKRTVRLALVLALRSDCAVDIISMAATIRPLAALRAALLYFRKFGKAADLRVWDIVKPLISSADLPACGGVRYVLRKVEWVPAALKPDYCATVYLALDKIKDGHADDVLCELMKCLHEVNEDLLEKVLTRTLEKMDAENCESYPALINRYVMLSKTDEEQKRRMEKYLEPFMIKLDEHRDKENPAKGHFFRENYEQIFNSLCYHYAFFDSKYQSMLVIERILAWIKEFLPRESYFKEYVKLHGLMLYYKAIRQSLKQKPEVLEDPVKRKSEGVEIVGFIFGKYIVKELVELKRQYFDTIVLLYRKAFVDFLHNYFPWSRSRVKFVLAIVKGILSDKLGPEGPLAIHVMTHLDISTYEPGYEGITKLLTERDKETQFFLHAEIFD